MQSTPPSKSSLKTPRSRQVIEPIPRTQKRHLERLFEESPAVTSNNWIPNGNAANISDVIHVGHLRRNRSNHLSKQRVETLSNDHITINICGDRYETHRTTLELYPNTLLGNHKQRKYYYDEIHKEYFFDRHRGCFEAILYYYQSNGRLRRPEYIPLDIFLEEVTFFRLGEEALNQIRKDENIKEVKKIRLPKNRIRRYIWATIEYPDYSLTAKIVNVLSLLMVIASAITLAVESLPQYTAWDDLSCGKIPTNTTAQTNDATTPTEFQDTLICHLYFTSPFFLIQAVSVGFFTIEFFVRLITTPSLLDFVKNPMNWIDIIAIVPFYITLGIYSTGRQNQINTNTYVGLRLLRIFRLARILKFCRVFKGVKSLRVLVTTVRQSLLDFFILIIILTLLGFLFGAAAYYVENDTNGSAYDSIPKATYWGIVTITSVGYGDIVPITPIGRVITSLCALFGAATIGMLVSVLVDRYQRVYARTLFINDEENDFDDYSDNENTNTDPDDLNNFTSRRRGSIIQDPDARAKRNSILELLPTSDSKLEIENPIQRNSNRIHFIVGYVENEKQETTQDLIEKISSVIVDKQTSEDNVSIQFVSNESPQQSSSSHRVRFKLTPSFDEGFNDDENLTEISGGSGIRGTILTTSLRSVPVTDDHSNNSEKNV